MIRHFNTIPTYFHGFIADIWGKDNFECGLQKIVFCHLPLYYFHGCYISVWYKYFMISVIVLRCEAVFCSCKSLLVSRKKHVLYKMAAQAITCSMWDMKWNASLPNLKVQNMVSQVREQNTDE